MEKSSYVREEAVAVLSVFRPDGFESRSDLEESLHVVFPSKAVVSGSTHVRFESTASSRESFDVRSSFSAVMEESSPCLSGSRA